MAITHSTLKKLGSLPTFDQLCMMVQDMPTAMAYYSTFLNVPVWYRSKTVSRETIYRGKLVELEADIVVGYSGRIQIELFQLISGEDNIYYEVFGDRGGGIHHVGIIVNDLDKYLARFQQANVVVSQLTRTENAGGAVIRTAHLDTTAYCGFVVELIEVRLKGISVGMPRWLMRLGVLTGNSERL
jgi:methylmalonyl-CoA/ethylmalonyl-CoA epimerase